MVTSPIEWIILKWDEKLQANKQNKNDVYPIILKFVSHNLIIRLLNSAFFFLSTQPDFAVIIVVQEAVLLIVTFVNDEAFILKQK